MFQPEKVERDKFGFYFNSALDESKEEDITKHPRAAGMEFRFIDFFDDAPEKLQEMYLADSDVEGEGWPDALKAWEPTQPTGEGWFLLTIYDTEDGPYACFTRPRAEVEAHA